MLQKRTISVLLLFCSLVLPVLGGTGKPSDGLFSYFLLLGFLLIILGILELAARVKRRIRELLEEFY